MPLNKPSMHLVLPLLSGVLGALCFPKVNQGYLAWIALVPLILYLVHCSRTSEALVGGFITGLIQNAGLLMWVPGVMIRYGGLPVAGAWFIYGLLVALQAAFPAAACALTGFCLVRTGRRLLLLLPFAWVSLEYLESHFPFGGFPWLLFGYSQTDFICIAQIADITGVYGVTFLVLCVNTALAWALLNGHSLRLGLWPLAVAGGLVTACAIYGTIAVRQWSAIETNNTAALLQECISIDDTPASMDWKFSEGYVKLSERLSGRRTDLVVLPESPSPLSYQYDDRYRALIARLAAGFPLGLVFNNIAFRDVDGTTRYFNSAYFVRQDGAESGRYDKIHLVPFGEYVPLKRVFFFMESITKDVSDFYPGAALRAVPVGGHPVGAIICFEAVFPQIARMIVSQGGELIVNLTNDGWYGNTAAPYQHLAMSRWRAIETRRFLLRAANTGVSAIIDPAGRVRSSTGLFREEICSGGFAFIRDRSVYSRIGDSFAGLCVIIMAAFTLCGLVKRPDAR